jgi:hypothetical protein
VIIWVMTRRYGASTTEFDAIQLTTAGSFRKKLRYLYRKESFEDISEEDKAKTNATKKKKRTKKTARKIQIKDTPSIPYLEALQEEENLASPERSMSDK